MLFIIILIVAILTYIIPAGQYEYITDDQGRTMVDAESFEYTDQSPISPFRLFVAI